MGHIADVVRQRAVARDFKQAVLETLVGEILRILRIHHTHAIDDEAVGIHVLSNRAKRHRPCSISLACHVFLACKLHVNLHLLCLLVLVSERHLTIRMAGNRRRCLRLLSPAVSNDAKHQKDE